MGFHEAGPNVDKELKAYTQEYSKLSGGLGGGNPGV